MPAPPEVRRGDRQVRRAEVADELEAEQSRRAPRDVGVGGEVREDLHVERERPCHEQRGSRLLEQEHLVQSGATRIDGRLPVNTDGGCLANGEPIGASGLRQVYENVLQLRGDAGDHQVPGNPRLGYTHVYGAPGISAVTIMQR